MSFSRQQILFVIFIACAALGAALCLRYLLVENPKISEMCEVSSSGWACASLRAVIVMFQSLVLGWIALAVAGLNLLRPCLSLLSIAIAATSSGLVLYNAGLASLAVALLLLTLARVSPGTACMPRQ